MCDKMSFCNVSKFYESDKKSKPEHHDITTINCYPLLTCSNNVHIPTAWPGICSSRRSLGKKYEKFAVEQKSKNRSFKDLNF